MVGADALYDIKSGKELKKTSVLVTFDDGYADNYVYAFPILKKYGIKALLFVPTSKIADTDKKRQTTEDHRNGKVEYSKLFMPDKEENALEKSLNGDLGEFLSWGEIDTMVKSGVFTIGSHGHVHAKIFSHDKVIGIYGKSKPHWSFEYAYNNDISEGLPIFEMKSSLSCKRFIPNEEFKKYALELYSKLPESELINKLNSFKNKGFYETNHKERIEGELKISKNIIKKKLGIDSPFLSWPWGEYTEESTKIAKSVGFDFCFSTKKQAFIGSNTCEIPRIKSSDKNSRFFRKVLFNSNILLAELYAGFH